MSDSSEKDNILVFKPSKESELDILDFSEDIWEEIDDSFFDSLSDEQIKAVETALFSNLFCDSSSNDNFGGKCDEKT